MAILTCFAPFKLFSSNEVAVGLLSSMVIDLQQLLKSLEDNPLSLRWCTEAMCVIKKTHSHFLLDFERSKVLASWEVVCMFDEYMSATLDLLELCNLLKSAISGLDRYRVMTDFMVTRLNDAAISTTKNKVEFERLERENYDKFFHVKKLREMNLNKERVSKLKLKTRTNMHVLQAIRSTMSIISLFIFCSILHPIPINLDEGFYTGMCTSNSSLNYIQKLVTSFGVKFQNACGLRRPVLLENKMIEDAFAEFKREVVLAKEVRIEERELSKSLEILKRRSMALKEGLDLLEGEVNELFENVMEGRTRVFNLINFH